MEVGVGVNLPPPLFTMIKSEIEGRAPTPPKADEIYPCLRGSDWEGSDPKFVVLFFAPQKGVVVRNATRTVPHRVGNYSECWTENHFSLLPPTMSIKLSNIP